MISFGQLNTQVWVGWGWWGGGGEGGRISMNRLYKYTPTKRCPSWKTKYFHTLSNTQKMHVVPQKSPLSMTRQFLGKKERTTESSMHSLLAIGMTCLRVWCICIYILPTQIAYRNNVLLLQSPSVYNYDMRPISRADLNVISVQQLWVVLTCRSQHHQFCNHGLLPDFTRRF